MSTHQNTHSDTAPQKLKTPAEVRAWLNEHGLSLTEWCRDNGFSLPLARSILDRGKPALRGQSHQIAVKLGMKHGVITRTPAEALQHGPHTQRRAQAESGQ